MASGTHRAQQEREARGFQWLRAGVPPTVQVFTLTPVTVILASRQELPLLHPSPRFWPGLPPVTPTFAFPQGMTIVTRQEQPWHPVPGGIIRKQPIPPPLPGFNITHGYIL